jgi:hypothetical protein
MSNGGPDCYLRNEYSVLAEIDKRRREVDFQDAGGITLNYIPRCGLCGHEYTNEDDVHADCPVRPTLSVLETACITVVSGVTWCRHFCCGHTEWVCRAKSLAKYLTDPDLGFTQAIPVNPEVALQLQIAKDMVRILRGYELGKVWPFAELIKKWDHIESTKPISPVGDSPASQDEKLEAQETKVRTRNRHSNCDRQTLK